MKMNKHYSDVVSYFDKKSDQYDDVDHQLYWVFSDKYFKEILKKVIPDIFINKKSLKMLDAGAGTGRWTMFVYDLFKTKYLISGTLIDISPGMIDIAKNKIMQRKLNEKFECMIGNIEKLDKLKDANYDLAISFYNVLSFVENPEKALKEINGKLKNGGIHISIVANKYHALYFSVLTNRLKEIDMAINQSKIRFNDDMPYIHCFTPSELTELYEKSGYEKIRIIGGPNFIYPGMEETRIHGSTKNIQNKLANRSDFNKLMKAELEFSGNNDISGRGNVLMAIASK